MLQSLASRVLMLGLFAVGTTVGGEDSQRNRYRPYPPVSRLERGLCWPVGQALPVFATPADTLDAIEVQALSVDEQHTFVVLQGLVNRVRPRLLLLDARTDEGRDTWRQTSTVGLGKTATYTRENKYDLLAKYASEVEGVVLYDPNRSPHYRNLADTVAGLERLLPVTVQVY